jgi:predicted membrane metal-binding protein
VTANLPVAQLELDPATANLPVRAVPTLQRLVDTEPVRLYLRPALVAVLGLLTAYGLVSDVVAPAWLALVDAAVAVGGWLLIERVRASVFAPRTHLQAVDVAKGPRP